MTTIRRLSAHSAGEIVPGDVSGGTNTSHTIVVGAPRRSSTPCRPARRRPITSSGARRQRARQGHRRSPPAHLPLPAGALPPAARLDPLPGAPRPLDRSTRRRGRCSRVCVRSPATPSSVPAALRSSMQLAGRHAHVRGSGRAVGEQFPASYSEARWRRSAGTPSRRGSRPATSPTAAGRRRSARGRRAGPPTSPTRCCSATSRASGARPCSTRSGRGSSTSRVAPVRPRGLGVPARAARLPPARRRGRGRLPRAPASVRRRRQLL